MTLTDENAGAAHHPRRARRRRPRWTGVFVSMIALSFFFGPTAAHIVGIHAIAIENRPLTPLPGLSTGWSGLPQLGVWATDHLPGRKQAVSAYDQANQLLDGVPVSPQKPDAQGFTPVVAGKQGWLFLGDDFRTKCDALRTPADTVARLTRLSDMIEQSGRRFLLVIAPDKSTVYPHYLPDSYVGKDCAPTFDTAFWDTFDQTPVPGNIDTRGAFLAAVKTSNEPLYRPKDTHWDQAGIVLDAQLLASRLDPALAEGTTIVSSGTYREIGDLTYLLGNPQADILKSHVVVRQGVTMTADSNLHLVTNTITHVYNTTSGAQLYQPSTLLLGDSFADTSKWALAPYFADLELLHNRSTPAIVAKALIDRRTVIVEVSERLGITGNMPLISDQSLAAIAAALKAHPVH